jgi:hypothetical protein
MTLVWPGHHNCRVASREPNGPRSVIFGILDHGQARPLVDLVYKIPAPICVVKEDIMAKTKLAASVLQDRNLRRSMNLDLSLDEFEILP